MKLRTLNSSNHPLPETLRPSLTRKSGNWPSIAPEGRKIKVQSITTHTNPIPSPSYPRSKVPSTPSLTSLTLERQNIKGHSITTQTKPIPSPNYTRPILQTAHQETYILQVPSTPGLWLTSQALEGQNIKGHSIPLKLDQFQVQITQGPYPKLLTRKPTGPLPLQV